MKLLDRILERAAMMAGPVKRLVADLHELAEQTEKLALNLAIVAHNQDVHHQLIQHMWHTQQVLLSNLQERSMDTQMPDIDRSKASKSKKPEKPN